MSKNLIVGAALVAAVVVTSFLYVQMKGASNLEAEVAHEIQKNKVTEEATDAKNEGAASK